MYLLGHSGISPGLALVHENLRRGLATKLKSVMNRTHTKESIKQSNSDNRCNRPNRIPQQDINIIKSAEVHESPSARNKHPRLT